MLPMAVCLVGRIGRVKIKQIKTTIVTKSYMKNWWEDDLPNILGINPIEAAIIFGTLYYFYGPNVLYEYAREAGKFVSTYAPVVKDVSFNIFNEFKDFLEEDRERNLLSKSGVDISKLPRRTSNIIERFQDGLSSFSSMTETNVIDNPDSLDISSSLVAKSQTTALLDERNPLKRKNKKEMLLAGNGDMESVMNASKAARGESPDNTLAESVSAIQNKISEIKNTVDENSAVADASISKFQQQMSGMWNQKVLDENPAAVNEYANYDYMNDNIDIGMDMGLTSSFVSQPMPETLSIDDDEPSMSSDVDKTAVKDLLLEIDQDYSKLRAKLVRILAKLDEPVIEADQVPPKSTYFPSYKDKLPKV